MNTVKTLVIIVVGIIASYIVYQGALFTPIVIKKLSFPELNIAYTTFIGPYHKAYPNVKTVEAFLQEKYGKDFSQEPCFGIYYDNPKEVDPSKCRSVIGKILPSNIIPGKSEGAVSFGKIESMKDTASVDYPMRSILSIYAGIFRVYPKLSQFYDSLPKGTPRGASFELYGFHGNNTTFMFPLSEAKGIAKEFPQ